MLCAPQFAPCLFQFVLGYFPERAYFVAFHLEEVALLAFTVIFFLYAEAEHLQLFSGHGGRVHPIYYHPFKTKSLLVQIWHVQKFLKTSSELPNVN